MTILIETNRLKVKTFSDEITIEISYESKTIGVVKFIDLYINKDKEINISATGTLNKAGQEALEDGLNLAKIIAKYHFK